MDEVIKNDQIYKVQKSTDHKKRKMAIGVLENVQALCFLTNILRVIQL